MVEDILAEAGFPRDQVTSVTPLSGGTFNDVFRVTLADGRRLILKVQPSPDFPLLAYEQGIMRTEALFYQLARQRHPVPAVVQVGFDRPGDARDFLLMTEIPGQPWPAIADQIDRDQRLKLRGDLGRIVADLHSVTGTQFGYPALPLADSWREAFGAMMETILTEADRYKVALPLPTESIRRLTAHHASVLDEVTTPVLVHFDLHDGNILVDTDGSMRIAGLIDAERAFWGDPLADFVCLALLDDIHRDEEFLAAYREAGGPASLDGSSPIRLSLYRSYMYLIFLVEAGLRQYPASTYEYLGNRVVPALAAELNLLAT